MPFDGELSQVKPAPANSDERWDVVPGKKRELRDSFVPLSDLEALRRILRGIQGKWAKQLNGPDGAHCIVGWTVQCSEPTTLIDFRRAQTARLLRCLHDALPKSAQRKWVALEDTLAHYNDTHSREAVARVVERAYLKLAEDLVEQANSRARELPAN